eukprot:Tbor_TRINITY_DN5598_c1_g1::TRINITY_DN5598_c1_g1_i2::g.12520::m.12520
MLWSLCGQLRYATQSSPMKNGLSASLGIRTTPVEEVSQLSDMVPGINTMVITSPSIGEMPNVANGCPYPNDHNDMAKCISQCIGSVFSKFTNAYKRIYRETRA